VAVAVCVIWGLFLLLKWSAEGRIWQVFLAGIVLGCIPTIRYPDAVMGGAVIVFILIHWRQRAIFRHLVACAIGAAVPIIPLLIRNQLVMGAFWRTGYSLTNEQTGFGWNYFKEHWSSYIYSLNADALGLFFALGIAGIALMLCTRRWRAIGLLL